MPFRTVTEGSHVLSDLTNLKFVGSSGAIEHAFAARVGGGETLISQPDFWSKSRTDILNNISAPDYTIQEVGPALDGAMRQQHATAGVSFTF